MYSQVLLARGTGERFPITWLVPQGFPLAPTMFLFFTEATSNFLTAHETDLRVLYLNVREEELIDGEFAQTAMYLNFGETREESVALWGCSQVVL